MLLRDPRIRIIEVSEYASLRDLDRQSEIAFAIHHTDMLLMAAHSADEIAAAGRRGLEAAAVWVLKLSTSASSAATLRKE